MRAIAILALIGAYIALGQRLAVAQTCFSNVFPCGSGDPDQSACYLQSNVTGTGTCRAYRTVLVNACANKDFSDEIGNLAFVVDGDPSETWVCTVQVNLRITQGSTAGNWEFNTKTLDFIKTPAGTSMVSGSFGGSFGPLQIAANASDLKQISGNAWGPQLGPFHGTDVVHIVVTGGDDQPGAVWNRININAMCCQGF